MCHKNLSSEHLNSGKEELISKQKTYIKKEEEEDERKKQRWFMNTILDYQKQIPKFKLNGCMFSNSNFYITTANNTHNHNCIIHIIRCQGFLGLHIYF